MYTWSGNEGTHNVQNVYPWGILFLANGRKSTMRWTKEGKHGKHGVGKVSKENTTFKIFVGQPSIHPPSSIHLCSVRRNTKVEIWLRVEVMVKTVSFSPPYSHLLAPFIPTTPNPSHDDPGKCHLTPSKQTPPETTFAQPISSNHTLPFHK